MPVDYCFKGRVDNSEVQQFYSENKIDCFITTSSTEGLPVSIMEAMSYEIPIVATDVGGIRELIDGNGVLLSSNPTIEEISDAIETIVVDCEKAGKMSERSGDIWDNFFNAENNAKKFADRITKESGNSDTLIMTIDSVNADLCFMKSELVELSKFFHVILIETKPRHEEAVINNEQKLISTINSDIEFMVYDNNWKISDLVKLGIRYFFDSRIKLERDQIKASKDTLIRRCWESVKYYASSEMFYRWLSSKMKLDNIIFYSFWMQDTTLAISRHKSNQRIYSRAHGYDLYDNRYSKGNRQPFREYMNEFLDGIFFISNAGKDYYKQRYESVEENKLSVCYLGSEKSRELGVREKYMDSGKCFTIVSCSNVIPLKRINLIIDAIAMFAEKNKSQDIRWIHFGDGEQMSQIKEYAKERLGEESVCQK